MRLTKLFFLLIVFTITFFSSCKKDNFEEFIEVGIENTIDAKSESNNTRRIDNNSNCTDYIEKQDISYATRSYIKKVIDLEISGPSFKDLGEPFYSSIISENIESENFDPYIVSYVPFIDKANNIVKSILIFYTDEYGSNYILISRNDIINSNPFSFSFNYNNKDVIKGKEDFLEMFYLFDYFYTCEVNLSSSIARNGGEGWGWWRRLWGLGPKCPDPAGGRNTKPPRCRNSEPAGFGGTHFIFIDGFNFDLPWGIGQGGMSNFPPNIVGNGNNGPLNPSFLDAILLLQMDCDADEVDPDGSGLGGGIDLGSIEPEVLNPAALQIHEQWCYYKEKCLGDELSGVQPLAVPVNHNANYSLNPYYIWGQYFSGNNETFIDVINTEYRCLGNEDLDVLDGAISFLDDFLEGETEIDISTITDAIENGDCLVNGNTVYNQCVFDQLMSEAPCADALDELMDEYEMELTPAQQLNLIGPGGSADCGNMAEFRDVVEIAMKTNLIKNCVNDDLLQDAIIEMDLGFDKILNLCQDIEELDPVCPGCDESKKEVIFDAHNKAIEALDCAYDKIGNFDVELPQNVKDCFDDYFGGGHGIFQRRLLQITLLLIKQGLQNGQVYDVQNNGSEPCNDNNAFVWHHTSPIYDYYDDTINLCDPNWFNHDTDEAVAIIIHEGTHAYLSTADLAYLDDPKFGTLDVADHFNNADSYEELIQCLCD